MCRHKCILLRYDVVLASPALLCARCAGARARVARDTSLELASKHLLDSLGRVRLGALEGHAEGTVPDKLGSNTKGTRDTKEDGVEVLLVEAVVGEEDTRVGVDVGPGVWS